MEQGICEGDLRVIIHEGDFVSRNIAECAVHFNNPPIVICEANHDGKYAASYGFLTLASKSAILSAWKRSEDGDGEILRLYEYAGEAQDVELCLFDKKFSVKMSPYEIKTLRLSGESLTETLITED
jgi:alpha-mannosidase